MRFAKILRFGGTRTTVGLDVYNLLNSNPVLTYNQAFSPTTTTWLRPNSVLPARFMNRREWNWLGIDSYEATE